MKSAELKETSKTTTKRVKHCYRRSEIYHQWVHDDKYVYTNEKSYNVAGHYDILLVGALYDEYSRERIVELWLPCYEDRCVGVIDRDKKLILVNLTYKVQAAELLRAVPDDFQIFFTEGGIRTPDIFSTGELDEVIKLHAKYLIKTFAETTLNEAYMVLKDKATVYHADINKVFKYNNSIDNTRRYRQAYHTITYNDIVDFVKDYKVKKRSWYKEILENELSIVRYIGWSAREDVVINLPSMKQIVDNKVFTAKEKLKLEQSYFYGHCCYGYGISRKEVTAKWNTPYDREELEARLKKENITINLDDRPNLIYWQDGIRLYRKALSAQDEAYIERSVKQSLENEREAKRKLAEVDESSRLEAFRAFKGYQNNVTSVEYQRFFRGYRKWEHGVWKTATIHNYNLFANTHLRYDGKDIETSRHAKVPLSAAVSMWKLYIRIVGLNEWTKDTDYIVRFDDKDIRVGIYNLRAIMYCKKKTDQGVTLDRYEWCIVIGCHYLWIDDFIDFVKYYNLYTEFGIDKQL